MEVDQTLAHTAVVGDLAVGHLLDTTDQLYASRLECRDGLVDIHDAKGQMTKAPRVRRGRRLRRCTGRLVISDQLDPRTPIRIQIDDLRIDTRLTNHVVDPLAADGRALRHL